MPNHVELIGVYGGDETIALSAWTSTNRDLTSEKSARIPGLLTEKLRDEDTGNLHSSPFEKAAVHFLVTTDIATHIHFLKHRIGVSVNAESARYKELKDDKYYVPEDWPSHIQNRLVAFADFANAEYHRTLNDLVALGVPRKRAKESARFFLPYATQIQMDVLFHFNTFMHFVEKRLNAGAQKEVRDVARQMLTLVFEHGGFGSALEAFGWKLIDGKPMLVARNQWTKLPRPMEV